jgi:Cdc6-like AAA superfamily ATPase
MTGEPRIVSAALTDAMESERKPTKRVGYVLIVGPDGSGKTAVMDQLHAMAEAAAVRVALVFWRPKLIPGGLPYGHPVKRGEAALAGRGGGSTLRCLLRTGDSRSAPFATRWRRRRGTNSPDQIARVVWDSLPRVPNDAA